MARLLTEFGMGSSLRRQDYTEAATRALKDALWHNSINLAELFGKAKEDMLLTVEIGVQAPDQVDSEALKQVFPYGQPTVHVRHGGLDIPRPDGTGKPTVMANAAISVALRGVGSDPKPATDIPYTPQKPSGVHPAFPDDTYQRFIIEMGMGNSQYGGDYTKAGARAIEDAIRHSSIPLFGTLGLSHDDMRLRVTVGTQQPVRVDTDALTASLPRGRAYVVAVQGGLDVTNPDTDVTTVIATAAVEAFLPRQD